ncbi:MAG: DUF3141 domain-containing protein [Usitatibacteraceae bacterium]
MHENVGHLGIFVGGEIARKEHDQLVTSLDVIESLPPGLYEMKLEAKAGLEAQRWGELEPGDYSVHYEYRTMEDIRALNPEGRDEEALFSTIAKVSEFNSAIYKTWMRPWVRMLATRPVADTLGKLHPLRMQRECLSDSNPIAPLIRAQAKQARAFRSTISDDHPLRKIERSVAARLSDSLNEFRDRRDKRSVAWTRQLYGPLGLGAFFKPDESDADIAHARAQRELAEIRESVLATIEDGAFAEAVCRIVLAGMASVGSFERRSLRLARLLAHLPDQLSAHSPTSSPSQPTGATARVNWVHLLRGQARIAAVAPVEALNALEHMLPDSGSRERALAVSAAVMMIEPTLANPRSEIVEFLIATLNVDAERVIALAKKLTAALDTPTTENAVGKSPAIKRGVRSRGKPAARGSVAGAVSSRRNSSTGAVFQAFSP